MMILSPDAYEHISARLDELERNETLFKQSGFAERVQALDFLELYLLDELEHGTSDITDPQYVSLIQRARTLKQRLEVANENLFAQLLASVRANDRTTIRQCFRAVEQQMPTGNDMDYVGYDALDILATGLLELGYMPDAPQERHPDMIFYQPTPARIIMRLIHALHLKSDDVFYDLGSGLGHVPILVNLLTNIRTKGVELEEVYHRYSLDCLNKFGLSGVELIHADARDVAYDDGTVFYMHTPFHGQVLRQVLSKLEAQAKQHLIRVCTYGPCTPQVAKQSWLQPLKRSGHDEASFAIFLSDYRLARVKM